MASKTITQATHRRKLEEVKAAARTRLSNSTMLLQAHHGKQQAESAERQRALERELRNAVERANQSDALLNKDLFVRSALEAGTHFVAVYADDPGYLEAYRAQRQLRQRIGGWEPADEARFRAALEKWLTQQPIMER